VASEKPLFADSWYDTPRILELRQEIQNLYQLIATLLARIEELESAP
jgi:hypothetical protein